MLAVTLTLPEGRGDAERFEFEQEKTVGDLKREVRNRIQQNEDSWRLSQMGFPLPDDNAKKLKDVLVDGYTVQLSFKAQPPAEGAHATHQITTDMTRLLVRGKRTDFDLLVNDADRDDFALMLRKRFHFFGHEKFGIVTNITNLGDDYWIQHAAYKVPRDGHIKIETAEDGKNVRVTLLPENNEQEIPLRPYDEKSWNTADQISPLRKRQMISEFVANVLGTVAGAVIQSQLG